MAPHQILKSVHVIDSCDRFQVRPSRLILKHVIVTCILRKAAARAGLAF